MSKRIILEDFANSEFNIKIRDGKLIIEAEGLVVTEFKDIQKRKSTPDTGPRSGD